MPTFYLRQVPLCLILNNWLLKIIVMYAYGKYAGGTVVFPNTVYPGGRKTKQGEISRCRCMYKSLVPSLTLENSTCQKRTGSLYTDKYQSMHVCMYVCMYVCVYIYILATCYTHAHARSHTQWPTESLSLRTLACLVYELRVPDAWKRLRHRQFPLKTWIGRNPARRDPGASPDVTVACSELAALYSRVSNRRGCRCPLPWWSTFVLFFSSSRDGHVTVTTTACLHIFSSPSFTVYLTI